MELFFKTGDLVSHQGLGNGTVKDTDRNNEDYPIAVTFENGDSKIFTRDGRYFLSDKYPSLLQGHNRFDPKPNKPIFEPKQGELVWANNDNNWFVGYFIEFDQFNIPTVGIRKGKASCHATEIRPFKGEIPTD